MNNVPTPPPAALVAVNDEISHLFALMDEWRARETDIATGRTYVAAGHEAVSAIDTCLRALHTLRGELLDELRRDEDERAVRVDLLLAECRAAREQADRSAAPVVAEMIADWYGRSPIDADHELATAIIDTVRGPHGDPDEAPAPVTVEHREDGGWKGPGEGSCGVVCSCGVTFDGFDSLGEALESLGRHIDDATTGQETGR